MPTAFYALIFSILFSATSILACPWETIVDAPRSFASKNLKPETPHRPGRIRSLFDKNHLDTMDEICRAEGLDLYPGIEYLNKDNVTKAITLFEKDWQSVLKKAETDTELAAKLDAMVYGYLKQPPKQGANDEYAYPPGLDEQARLNLRTSPDELFTDEKNWGYLRAVMLNLEQSKDGAEILVQLSKNNNPDSQSQIITRSRGALIISGWIKRRLPNNQRDKYLFENSPN